LYVGRLCLVGVSITGAAVAAYLLSSRTYPERMIDIEGVTAKVVPRKGLPRSYPSHLYYDCIKVVDLKDRTVLLVGNGTHTDYIESMIPRDIDLKGPISEILGVLGCERDEKKTPRIVGIASEDELILGVVSEDRLDVERFEPYPGRAYYVSTYQMQQVGKHCIEKFRAENALATIKILKMEDPFRSFTDYLGSAAANLSGGRLDLACD
jgi:IMP cyclohydrolase